MLTKALNFDTTSGDIDDLDHEVADAMTESEPERQEQAERNGLHTSPTDIADHTPPAKRSRPRYVSSRGRPFMSADQIPWTIAKVRSND